MDAPSQIVQRCIQDVPSISAPYMPTRDAMRMMVHRVRNKNFPSIPKDIHAVVIPDELTKINNGVNFLIGHFTHNKESVIVFGTNESCRLLSEANYWLMDGTFMYNHNMYDTCIDVEANTFLSLFWLVLFKFCKFRLHNLIQV
ncbi:hypothetical protein PYW08_016004 [Mythimna loreyi]|uniref:Uncharacterized protein n=1 Tax=Mythimna loreyi TaxID=667449 RepID=A0ACC2QSU2_9NEOP|nr:hypothetical protein PYW08_016004 [Mythimna loreyi]